MKANRPAIRQWSKYTLDIEKRKKWKKRFKMTLNRHLIVNLICFLYMLSYSNNILSTIMIPIVVQPNK